MNILGIETSCDETSAAIVADGCRVLANVVSSQIPRHAPYGGVVPEIACRAHVELLPVVIRQALETAGVSWDAVDGLAVTYGPGLASSLMIGLAAAKALAWRLGKPLCPVHHLQGHLYSPFLDPAAPRPDEVSPLVALLVSGGHTLLVARAPGGALRLLGTTLDDAAGEAFDKGAQLLGLGYPGGPAIERAAKDAPPAPVVFPRGRIEGGRLPAGAGEPDCCFSFSGLKTALRYYLEKHPEARAGAARSAVAAAYQDAICGALLERLERALERTGARAVVCAGGVACNGALRAGLASLCAARGVRLLLARPGWCTDNAAMIAGWAGTQDPATWPTPWTLELEPHPPLARATP